MHFKEPHDSLFAPKEAIPFWIQLLEESILWTYKINKKSTALIQMEIGGRKDVFSSDPAIQIFQGRKIQLYM